MTKATLDTSVPGTHTLHYITQDFSGNVSTATRTVEVVEVTGPPVLTLEGSFSSGTNSTRFSLIRATPSPTPTAMLWTVPGCKSVFCPTPTPLGLMEMTYTFSDVEGIPAEPKTQVVVVEDTVAPTLELTGDAEVTIVEGEAFEDPESTLVPETESGILVSSNRQALPKTSGSHRRRPDRRLCPRGRGSQLERHLRQRQRPRRCPAAIRSWWRRPLADCRLSVPIDDYMAASGTEVRNHYSIFTVSRIASNNGNGKLLSTKSRNWYMGYL